MLRPLRDLVDQSWFVGALAVGAVGLLISFGTARLCRPRPSTAGGLVSAIAVVIALITSGHAGVGASLGRLMVGLVALSVAGGAARVVRMRMARAALVVPGAVLIVSAAPDLELGQQVAWSAIVVVLAALALEWADRPIVPGGGFSLLLITVAGVYLCVPDTEQAAIVLGVAVPMVVLGLPLRIGELGHIGIAVWVGVCSWTAVSGGAARPGSIAGALGCIGLLLFARRPTVLARWGRSSPSLRAPRGTAPVVVLVQLLVVIACSRLAGRLDPGWVAGCVVVACFVVGLALMEVFIGPGPDRETWSAR